MVKDGGLAIQFLMAWYEVTKIIGGRAYRYKQRTYREGGKVRSQCKYIGPVSDVSRSSEPSDQKTSHNPFILKAQDEVREQLTDADLYPNCIEKNQLDDFDDWVPSNPFLPAEMRGEKAVSTRRASFRKQRIKVSSKSPKATYTAPFDVDQWKPGNPFREFERKIVSRSKNNQSGAVFANRSISMLALQAEYARAAKQLSCMGLNSNLLASIKIFEGKKPGWIKSKSTYKVNFAPSPKGSSGRNLFKKNFRLAIAHAILDQIQTQDPSAFESIRHALDYSWVNTKLLVIGSILASNQKERGQNGRMSVLASFLWSGGLPKSMSKKLGAKFVSKRSLKSASILDHVTPITWRDEAAILMADVIQRGYTNSEAKHRKMTNRAKANARRSFKQYQKLTRLQRLSRKGRKKWANYKRHETAYLLASKSQSRLKMLAPFLRDFHN